MQKIKKDLIHKAKLKQQYAKLKAREEKTAAPSGKSVYDREAEASDGGSDGDNGEPAETIPEPSLEPHPDRVKMLEEEDKTPEAKYERPTDRRQQRPRPQPFLKESEVARKHKDEVEVRQKARETADKERAAKLAERERFRKTMAKAHGGSNGKRKLGLESTVLLTKIQRSMGKT